MEDKKQLTAESIATLLLMRNDIANSYYKDKGVSMVTFSSVADVIDRLVKVYAQMK